MTDLRAGGSSNLMYGGEGNDRVAGSYGSDMTYGGAGDDKMGGGFGHDIIRAGSGDDIVGAGEQNDTVYGDEGDDILNGGSGDDVIFGGADDDRINGGAGQDVMTGVAGADTFVFSSYVSGETEVITDFSLGEDILRLARVGGATAEVKFDKLDISQVGVDAHIEWNGQTIVLSDVDMTDLSSDSFLFV